MILLFLSYFFSISLLKCIILFQIMMIKQYYPVYEEVVISVLADNHNPSNMPVFVTGGNIIYGYHLALILI